MCKLFYHATKQAVANTLLKFFISSTAKVKERKKSDHYRYVITKLASKAQKGPLDEARDPSIERWTQSTSFVDAFSLRALASLHYTRPVANYVKSHMEKSAGNGANRWMPKPYYHLKLATRGQNLRLYPGLETIKHARKAVVLATRLEHQRDLRPVPTC